MFEIAPAFKPAGRYGPCLSTVIVVPTSFRSIVYCPRTLSDAEYVCGRRHPIPLAIAADVKGLVSPKPECTSTISSLASSTNVPVAPGLKRNAAASSAVVIVGFAARQAVVRSDIAKGLLNGTRTITYPFTPRSVFPGPFSFSRGHLRIAVHFPANTSTPTSFERATTLPSSSTIARKKSLDAAIRK